MATVPTRIDRDLFDAAASAGAVHRRSAAQQLDYWARLGRELEASPTATHDTIERVLNGQASYDELAGPAQAVVRASWREQIADRLAALNFEDELKAGDVPWSEADADGTVVVREPGSAGG